MSGVLDERAFDLHHNLWPKCSFDFPTKSGLSVHQVQAYHCCDNKNNLRLHPLSRRHRGPQCYGYKRLFPSFSAMIIRLEAGACARGTGLRSITLPVVKCHSAHRQSGMPPYCYPSCERVFTTLSGTCQHAEYFLSVVEPHVEAHFLLRLSLAALLFAALVSQACPDPVWLSWSVLSSSPSFGWNELPVRLAGSKQSPSLKPEGGYSLAYGNPWVACFPYIDVEYVSVDTVPPPVLAGLKAGSFNQKPRSQPQCKAILAGFCGRSR
uniref:Uncharacterized protein n=1 Tax=Coccidioides posadasii RMSCC 3488 TaxID=454284 RepID=A0A0J6HY25_COCPO|nr:hypothetical protein CPAG_00220 [Coccidioides posadasii RMSCC 3488]